MNLCSFIGHKWVVFNSFYVLEYLELALGEELAKLPTENVLLLIEQLSKHMRPCDLIAPDMQSLSQFIASMTALPKAENIKPHIDYLVKYTEKNIDPILAQKAGIEAKASGLYLPQEYLRTNNEYQRLRQNAERVTTVILPFFAKIKLLVCARCNIVHDPRLALKPMLSKIYSTLKLEKINAESGIFAI